MNRICKLFNISYPIVQGGMVWCSGWKLASAVSNSGGLGLIGSGSMHPETLIEHIRKCKAATSKPFGVNVPLMYPDVDKIMDILVHEGVKIVFTSAGSPDKWTNYLKDNGIIVVHVVANSYFAQKSEKAKVDAIVAEGFEAGGHNGREETTTMALIPQIRQSIDLPLIAAGGIGSGQAIMAAFSLGAEGVQIGSLFAAAIESSAHESFKQRILLAKEGDTMLTLKQLAPVRLIKNKFFDQVNSAQLSGAQAEQLRELLGKGRAKTGMFEGNMEEGELEIGQVSSMIKEIRSVQDIMKTLLTQFQETKDKLKQLDFQS